MRAAVEPQFSRQTETVNGRVVPSCNPVFKDLVGSRESKNNCAVSLLVAIKWGNPPPFRVYCDFIRDLLCTEGRKEKGKNK